MIQSWCCHTILSHYTSCTAQNEIDQLRCVLIYGLLFAYADVLRWKGEMKWLDKMAYIVGYILRCLPTLHGLFISLNSWAVKQMIMTNWCGKYKKKTNGKKNETYGISRLLSYKSCEMIIIYENQQCTANLKTSKTCWLRILYWTKCGSNLKLSVHIL